MRSARASVGGVIAAAALSCAAAAAPAANGSHVTAIDIAGTQPVGTFDGVAYVRTYGVLHGVVDAREPVAGLAGLTKDAHGAYDYATEFEIIAPAPNARPADIVLIEAENRGTPLSINKINEMAATGSPAAAKYKEGLGNGFLERHATAYARVQWQTGISAGVPAAAQGVGLVIMRDFARLLRGRDAGVHVSGGALPAAYKHAMLVGISQSGWYVVTYVAEGFNADPRTHGPVFDAAIAIDGTGNWLALNTLAAKRGIAEHPYVDPNGVPLSPHEILHRPGSDPLYIDVANYTDFYRVRASVTDKAITAKKFRRYDWPSAHAAIRGAKAAAVVFDKQKCNGGQAVPLNPIDYQPYLRALVLEAEKAVGVATAAAAPNLPRSVVFKLGPAPTSTAHFNPLPGVTLGVPQVDDNAMPVGGVRFPDADYPVGRPVPVSLPPVDTTSIDNVCGNRGQFQPFPAAVLAARYGSEANYVALYRARVEKLVAAGFVLPEDEPEMLKTAAELYRAP
jgi:hypothetical protein